MQVQTASYILDGRELRVQSECLLMSERLDWLIAPLAVNNAGSAQAADDKPAFTLEIRLLADAGGLSCPTDKPAWQGRDQSGSEIQLHIDGQRRWYVLADKAIAEIAVTEADQDAKNTADSPAGITRAVLTVVDTHQQAAANSCLVPVIAELFYHSRCHLMHAAAITAKDAPDAAIFLGECGRGKTTAALAAMCPQPTQSRWQLICDDACLLKSAGDKLLLSPLPRSCKISKTSLELLDWPKQLPRTPADTPDEYRIDYKNMPTSDAHAEFTPKLVFLLGDRNDKAHKAEPLEAITALAEIAKLNLRRAAAVDTDRTARSFACFTKLTKQARCYRLSLGPQLDNFGDFIWQLMAV